VYNRVVIAYDGTREGRTALREGLLVAHHFGSELYVLAVVLESPGIRMAEGAHAGVMAHQDEAYRAILDEAVQGLRDYGFKVKGKLLRGEPAPCIGAYAREIKADLVVVGHRKQGFLQRWWSGPSGAYVSDLVDCSILVARNFVSEERVREVLESPRNQAAPPSSRA